MEVGSSNKSSLMQALHFCGPELEGRKTNIYITLILYHVANKIASQYTNSDSKKLGHCKTIAEYNNPTWHLLNWKQYIIFNFKSLSS